MQNVSNKDVNKDVAALVTKVNDYSWDIPTSYKPGMRVPGRIFVSSKLLENLERNTLDQTASVATLPGIQGHAMAMPDAHSGYGFPIGGVAAFDRNTGIISPGGVGYDINCGVRIIRTDLSLEEVRPGMKELIELLFRGIPSGVGSKSKLRASDRELTDALLHGAKWAVESGYGVKEDLEHCEENGFMEAADPSKVGNKARSRGKPQFGTLGSGNHFLEVQYVDEVYDEEAAEVFGLHKGQITVMIHCGSRGAGHQICEDNLKILDNAARKYGIVLPDKQLACAPAESTEGQNYFRAMAAGANYAWANRQVITHWVREVFTKFFGRDMDDLGMHLVYDVAHNVAKLEEHTVDGEKKMVYVHRKGATRAFPPGHPDIPRSYRKSGQPVLIPGSMGTPSFVLHGTYRAMELTFGSACHGAGRVSSRTQALKAFDGETIQKELAARGISVRATRPSVIAEEAPSVYKSSEEVVDVVHQLGIARKVVRVMPIGVAKG
ncbi:tRNA-splicing ligase RtcB [Candidatus Methanoperedens nitroreducens]|uniref:tRNA-splicing ligase RtcB n=1 Tax=Candidatus Methanoperedens nitratireducens TaxID=1392998 RepID=A0A062V413_9EURY|nr:RtcB family protein [Candidatus Methanoperedens nitroreducens]KCZ72077.1 tRNA-splicing ligase RtcB [Candidatus Methanoperedens nitroreducens]MDJ1421948.1 RtcB family protein [Candidatus Methanoperedens sp.]